MSYSHQQIEKKWQDFWYSNDLFKANDDLNDKRERMYILDMFPYPSGAGLHVGHPEGYTATDIISRYKRMNGYNVLHPMGWDAFGLPAENYAIKTKIHPDKSTHDNIKTFTKQIKSLGFSYDWDREVATCNADYYKWTQWWFLFLYKNGLAYKKQAPVNYCESCKTVLANEQVVDGKCERCRNDVLPKNLNQWFFKITDFIDDNDKTSGLLNGLEKIDWPESTKISQKNWIGRSEGINFKHRVKDLGLEFEVYDSVPQTFLAQTFVIIAPEHSMVKELVKGTEYEKKVMEFVDKVKHKKAIGRFDIENDMEGIFTGRYSENYMGTGRDLPIWVASFALMDYGTGIVGCSAHDERDFAFAKKYNIDLKPVMFPKDPLEAEKVKKLEYCYCKDPEGIMELPEKFKGKKWGEVRNDIINYIVGKDFGRKNINYKMRDWLVSRQRYWGAPIPIIYCESCGEVAVEEKDLPILLPTDVDFMPTGESPLIKSKTFHNVKCPKCGKTEGVKRESDTMDTFVCSSWYFWRFIDPRNLKEFAAKDLMKTWGNVDLYVGGAEHTVLHLLYARFFCKVLHKYGYIDYDEPFQKLRHQGIILGEDGDKMSKSKGNVINPDEIVKKYGADTLRLYEMFMGPFKDMKPWNTKGVEGMYRFLNRVWKLCSSVIPDQDRESSNHTSLEQLHHFTIKKVTQDIENFDFNTAISQMMIYSNAIQDLLNQKKEIARIDIETLTLLLSPFAPHITEEIWHEFLGNKDTIQNAPWPKFDENKSQKKEIELVIQINGKLRGKLICSPDISKEEALKQTKELPEIKKYLNGHELKKEIFVPGKLVSLVVV
jgi:leucyl-tRNA synthetase